MAVLSRLLSKFSVKPKTLEEQLAELDQLSTEVLVAIAVEGQSEVLRLAAIARLDYGPALVKLAYNGGAASVQQKARQRLAVLIDKGTITLEQLSTDGIDPAAQFSVVGFCQQDSLIEQLLNSSNDQRFFNQIALEGVSIKLRQLAAEKIEDEGLLKALLKRTKRKDKQVYKIVKDKCDGFRDRDQRVAQTQSEIVSLCERLEAQSKRPFDKLFAASVKHLQEQWALLQAQADDAIVSRVHQANTVCEQTINAFLQQQSEKEAREFAIANATQQQGAIIGKLRDVLAHLFACLETEEERRSTEAALDEFRQQWLDAIQYKPAQKPDRIAFKQLEAGIEFQLQQLREHGSLVDQLAGLSVPQAETPAATGIDSANTPGYNALLARVQTADLLTADLQPQPLSDALAFLAEREKQGADTKQAEKNRLRHLGALIRNAQSAIDSGRSRSAVGIRRTIEEKRSGLETMPTYLSRQLEQLDLVLEKLLDWKNYAVEPKKQQLVEQMQALVDSQEKPEVLAVKIRRLQDEWKSLSKGGQDQALWETFHQVAQQAYQPCKVFYEQQAEIRQKNLEKRSVLLTQLQDYFSAQPWDAEQAEGVDWSAVEKLLTAAIREWRCYSPIERVANKPVQQDFERVLDAIREKLNEHYQKNSAFKQQLIEQVAQLVDHQDNRKAVEEVKRLQARWKQVGPASRRDEQALWKTFRKGCDAIFEKRQQQTDEFKAELDANSNAARALQHEVAGLLELSGRALLDARTRVAECQQAYKVVGDLPRAKANRLNQDFYRSIEQFENKVSEQLKTAKEQVWLDFLAASDKIRLYQIAENAETAVVLEQEARAFIASVEQWPKNGLTALEQKMAQGTCDVTQEENEQSLKRLCIRAEILCDRPTPDEDKSLRMQYQVSRLEQGLGQKTPDRNTELNAMKFEWVAVGSVSTAIYQPLLGRFLQNR